MKKLIQLFTCLLAITVLITSSVYASTIATPKIISNTANSHGPALDIVGENVFVSYSDFLEGSGVFFTRSIDGGVNFSTPIEISGVKAGEVTVLNAQGTNVYVIWPGVIGPSFGTDGVYFSRSTDSGNTFSFPVRISGLSPNVGSLDIEASANIVYVTWTDENSQIVFSRSTDEGTTFSTPVIISTISPLVQADVASIAASGNDVYLAWIEEIQDQPNRQLFVAHSSDFGSTFLQKTVVPGANQADNPGIVINKSGQNLFLVWREDELDPIRSIDFVRSEDGGITFSTPLSIDTGNFSLGEEIDDPSLAINNKLDLNLFWFKNGEIFFSRSIDEGFTFSFPENVSQDNSSSTSPNIKTNNMGKSFVVWTDSSSINDSNVLFTTITP